MKNPSVTIAIAAYNAQENIVQLTKSLIAQKQSTWNLDSIVVHSDCSQDDTVGRLKTIKSKFIKVINNTDRLGFGGSVKILLKNSKSDITLLLNDDIQIVDKNFVNKIVNTFCSLKNIGLVTARPVPLPAKTFIEKSSVVAIHAFEDALYTSGRYNNLFTCDGKVLALSKKFITKSDFINTKKPTGNVDTYLYLSCKKLGFEYLHAKDAIVYFRCPTTLRDWIRWTSRNNADKFILQPTFGELVEKEFRFPSPIQLVMSILNQATHHPLEVAMAYVVGRISAIRAKSYMSWLSATWDVVTTSKLLH